MTQEQNERINLITEATDRMKQNIRDRFEHLRNATDDELIEHCVFIEGVLAGAEEMKKEFIKTKDSYRSALKQLGDLREQMVNWVTTNKKQ